MIQFCCPCSNIVNQLSVFAHAFVRGSIGAPQIKWTAVEARSACERLINGSEQYSMLLTLARRFTPACIRSSMKSFCQKWACVSNALQNARDNGTGLANHCVEMSFGRNSSLLPFSASTE